ncbi:MAG: MBL fold metallo-hydrolase [Elusimicrobia bacterium CG06_land_8_20_14_3_00_38_11]|nr:MAG: MBL fold metallo-hydrolase [Elusimicrobia bacterium CG06_land_8_20_14_3_00_38_11]
MKKVEVAKNVFWVGVVDWNVRNFHGHTYTTKRGSTYNAYIIIDKKIALVDTVLGSFSDELIEKIKDFVDPAKIDYIIANHVETDHSGALPEIMRHAKNAKVVGTAKCKEGLYRHYYEDWDFQVVKTGDSISLGEKTLKFIEAPMIHWPDSMFTYIPEDKLLLPNDAFGQHIATTERFDDEVDQCALMDEATKYYANILIPYSPIILKKIDEVVKSGLEIKTIAPSHGIIWRKDPMKIVNAYIRWAKGLPLKKNILIVYETMWGATEKMAKALLEGVRSVGCEAKLYNISTSDRTEIIKEIFDAKGLLVGSSTHDNNILPNIAGFLDFVKGLKIKNRIGASFGSFGWSGESVKIIENILRESGIEVVQPPISAKYIPSSDDIKSCFEFGKNFAAKI